MALAYLFVLLTLIIVVSVTGIIALYFTKNKKAKNIIYYTLFVWSLIISFINITSLPSNYIFQQAIGAFIGILSIVSVCIKLKLPNKSNIAYLTMVISVILTVFDIIF